MSVYGQNVFSRKEVFARCNNFKDGRIALNSYPEEHRGSPRTSCTDENCVIVEGLREDLRPKIIEKQLCSTSHPLESNDTVNECLNL
jgi:hypothetical protein